MGENIDSLPQTAPVEAVADAPAYALPFDTFTTLPPKQTSIKEDLTNLAEERLLSMLNDKPSHITQTRDISFNNNAVPENSFNDLNLVSSNRLHPNLEWVKDAILKYTEHRQAECGFTSAGKVCGLAIQNLPIDQQIIEKTHAFIPLVEIKDDNLTYSFGIIEDYDQRSFGNHLKRAFIGAQPYINEIKENLEQFGEEKLGPVALQALIIAKQIKGLEPTGIGIEVKGNIDLSEAIQAFKDR